MTFGEDFFKNFIRDWSIYFAATNFQIFFIQDLWSVMEQTVFLLFFRFLNAEI